MFPSLRLRSLHSGRESFMIMLVIYVLKNHCYETVGSRKGWSLREFKHSLTFEGMRNVTGA